MTPSDAPTWAWITGILVTVLIAIGSLWLRSIHAALRDIQQAAFPRMEQRASDQGERLARAEASHTGLAEWMHRLDDRLAVMEHKLDRIVERRP